jgi:3-oxoadipate enol-lactonase
MRGQFISIDSINYYIAPEGKKNKPLVILCYVPMANHLTWQSTIEALHKAGYGTIRVDLNETMFASPEAIARQYHCDDFARHIHECVQQLAPARIPFTFIGCSVWGVIALRYAHASQGYLV